MHPVISIEQLCKLSGYTPQAYHKHNKKKFLEHYNEGLILHQIDAIRKHQPRCGGRKLLVMLQAFFAAHKINIGRDKFFDLLKRNKLLVRKIKRRSVYTTMSKHHYHRYPNLVKGFTPLKAHELWVSDDMKVSSATVALKQALAQKPAETIVIHHSDCGIQYCSHEYVSLLKEHHAMISMTGSGDPLENAIAERVSGILKTELISNNYSDIHAASIHISRCITIYNHRRRHSSLNWQLPAVVHEQKGPQIRRWKNYYCTAKLKEATMQET